MRSYAFDIALAADVAPSEFDGPAFLDAVEGPLFEAFEGDVTPAVTAGTPYLLCDVEAPSFSQAVRRVLKVTQAMGLRPVRLEVEPDEFAADDHSHTRMRAAAG